MGETKTNPGYTIQNSQAGQNAARLIKEAKEAKAAASASAGAGAKPVVKTVGAVAGAVGGVAGAGVGVGVDLIVGGMQIADTVQRNDSSGQKAYKITGDVIGIGVNIATGIISGPAMFAIIFFQVCGAILDAAWNPFKNYFNSDLETIRLGMINSLKDQLRVSNLHYPIETKPDILSSLDDKNSAQYKEFIDFSDTYLADRGLIMSEDVRAEEEYFLALQTLKRQRKLYRIDENGDLVMQDPNISATSLDIFSSDTNNNLLIMALAARYRRSGQADTTDTTDTTGTTDTTDINYITGAFIISVLFLIFFFLSIFIASI